MLGLTEKDIEFKVEGSVEQAMAQATRLKSWARGAIAIGQTDLAYLRLDVQTSTCTGMLLRSEIHWSRTEFEQTRVVSSSALCTQCTHIKPTVSARVPVDDPESFGTTQRIETT